MYTTHEIMVKRKGFRSKPVLPFTNLSYLTSLIVSLVCKMGIVVHTSSKPCEKLNEVTDVIIKLSDAAYNILILNK